MRSKRNSKTEYGVGALLARRGGRDIKTKSAEASFEERTGWYGPKNSLDHTTPACSGLMRLRDGFVIVQQPPLLPRRWRSRESMITVVDYKLNNLRSIENTLRRLGHNVEVTSDPEVVQKAQKLILPGVGAFRDAMANLKNLGLVEPFVKAFVAECRHWGFALACT